jgi:hypothetical protein
MPDSLADNEEPIIETRPNYPHIGADEVGQLLEGRLGEIERAEILAHLQTCRQCVEFYLDSAAEFGFQRVGDIPVWSTRKTKSPVGLGMQAPAQGDAARVRGAGVERVSGPGLRAGWKIRAGAVAVSIVVVIAVLWYGAGVLERSRFSRVSSEVLRPIQTAAGEFSRVGEVVLPGGESYIGESGPVFRSLNGRAEESLALSLKDLLGRFLGGSRSADVAYWLVAGYLSSGDVRTAAVYVRAARERFPDDPRLNVLDATVAYFRRDFARSESLLRDVVKAQPDDPLAAIAQINLALALRDQGKLTEAREILRSVAERYAAEPVGERARDVAASLGA